MRSLFAALAALTLLTTAACADAVPQLVNYQGKVYQPSGAAVPDGAYKVAFSIYDVPTGGTAIWTETYDALQVKGSAFHVLLGSINPIGASIFGSAERFLGVKLATDPELSPRQKIASVPYALVAEKAATAGTATTATTATEASHAAAADTALLAQTVPDGAISADKLSDASVGTAKIADGAVTVSKLIGIKLLGCTGALAGGGASPPASTGEFKMQAGTHVGWTNANGDMAIGFPVAFPNGVLTVLAVDGDSLGTPTLSVSMADISKASFVVSSSMINLPIRVNFIAIGW